MTKAHSSNPSLAGNMPYIDAHLHLQDQAFTCDRDDVIQHTLAAGVTTMLCQATVDSDWHDVIALSQHYPVIRPALGVHPWFVQDCQPDWLDRLSELLQQHHAIMGEIGLDRWITPRDESQQELFFRQQLRLARKLNRPVSIHCLKAWDWLEKVFSDEKLPPALHFHAFNGSADILQEMIDKGAYFSFSGRLFAQNNHRTREIFKQVPLHRLLMETDAPDLPVPDNLNTHLHHQPNGKVRNHPANLIAVYRESAALLDIPQAEFNALIADNFQRFWNNQT